MIIAGYSLPAFLHGVGIILLYKAKGILPNQRIITINLAVAEMLYCLLLVIHHVLLLTRIELSMNSKTIMYYQFVVRALNHFFYYTIRFAMFHIIIDRFLYIWLNIKYPLCINKRTLIKCIICQWTLGGFMSGISHLLVRLRINIKHIKYILSYVKIAMDAIIFITALATVLYLFKTVKRASRGYVIQDRGQIRTSRIWVRLKIPLLMVGTFVMFNISATMCWSYTIYTGRRSLVVVIVILNTCGWCFDVLIYVFLQRKVRLLITSFCRKFKANRPGEMHLKDISVIVS